MNGREWLAELGEEAQEAADAICDACRSLHARNLLAAADGNVSVRLRDGGVLITPEPSTERHMHLTIYDRCPNARAVVHAHPPTAIAWSVAHPDRTALPSDVLPEVILAAGTIPIAPYARPGTAALGEGLAALLPDHRIVILQRHGAVAWGESLDEAYYGMERVEHVAQILKAAHELGGLHSLPAEDVRALIDARRKIGPRTL
jgi:L-fuculose-phosphate aldolase